MSILDDGILQRLRNFPEDVNNAKLIRGTLGVKDASQNGRYLFQPPGGGELFYVTLENGTVVTAYCANFARVGGAGVLLEKRQGVWHAVGADTSKVIDRPIEGPRIGTGPGSGNEQIVKSQLFEPGAVLATGGGFDLKVGAFFYMKPGGVVGRFAGGTFAVGAGVPVDAAQGRFSIIVMDSATDELKLVNGALGALPVGISHLENALTQIRPGHIPLSAVSLPGAISGVTWKDLTDVRGYANAGNPALKIDVDAASYTLPSGTRGAFVSQSGAVTVTLPDAQSNIHVDELIIADVTGLARTITVEPAGTDTINGGVSETITTAYGVLKLTTYLVGSSYNWVKT